MRNHIIAVEHVNMNTPVIQVLARVNGMCTKLYYNSINDLLDNGYKDDITEEMINDYFYNVA